jgi:hypothetical protein
VIAGDRSILRRPLKEDEMKARTVNIAMMSVFALLGAGAAIAAEYNFVVPVDVRDLPADVRMVRVYCDVFADPGAKGASLGRASAQQTVAGGDLTAELRVTVTTAAAERRPGRSWKCELRPYGVLPTGAAREWVPRHTPSTSKQEYFPAIPSKVGTAVSIIVTGDIK